MRYPVLILLMHFSSLLFSQGNDPEASVVREEELTEWSAAQWEGNQILLEQYRKRPMDLNRCTAEELAELGCLTPLQIDAWIRFRKKFGAASDWYVFQGVPGWSEGLVARLKQYCRLGLSGGHAQKLFLESAQHVAMMRISVQRPADLPNDRLGSLASRQFRYRFQSEAGVQAGLLMESDAGEPMGSNGPDFVSGFLKWKKGSGGVEWLMGDYSVQLGQGLICWQGMAFGVGSDVSAVKRQGLSIRPYHSVGESRFLRGVAVGKPAGKWGWDVFLSRHPQTATTYPLAAGRLGFRQIDASGYHRTNAERAKKNALTEYTGGGRLGRKFEWGRLNLNLIARNWSISKFRADDLSAADTSWIRSLGNLSLDASVTKGSLHAFGEVAVDDRGNGAGVIGLVAVIDRRVDVSLHGRWIGNGFESVDGQAFQRSASGNPERGGYVQMRIRADDRHAIDLFVDFHRTPLPGHQLSVPGHGVIRGFRWQYQPDKKNLVYVRLQTVMGEAEKGGATMPLIRATRQHSIRVHGNFRISEQKSLSLRVERSAYHEGGAEPQQGFLTYVEWSQSLTRSGAGADLRIMWASTDGWSGRIYAYERDVLHKVGFPAFYGQLLRGYLNTSLPMGRRTTIWVKGHLQKNVDSQSLTSFSGKVQSGLTIQLRYQW